MMIASRLTAAYLWLLENYYKLLEHAAASMDRNFGRGPRTDP
ncbi:MAG: hypothetical protein AAF631_10385 [Pseudomonadota bacterium]